MPDISIFLMVIGGIALYCVLSYAIAWTYFLVKSRFNGGYPLNTGPMIGFILFFAPIVPFIFTWEFYTYKMYHRRGRKLQGVSNWIANNLKLNGIKIKEVTAPLNSFGYCCSVVAEVDVHSAQQIKAYRKIYAKAIKQFPKLKPETICRAAKPEELLDQVWAVTNGFTEYFAQETSIPCEKCGTVEISRTIYHWGDSQFHLERTNWYKNKKVTGKLKDGGSFERIAGFLCRSCIRQLDRSKYSSISY